MLFLEIDERLAGEIAGMSDDSELQVRRFEMLARNGALTVNELRQWAGLSELPPQLAGNVTVGRELASTKLFVRP